MTDKELEEDIRNDVAEVKVLLRQLAARMNRIADYVDEVGAKLSQVGELTPDSTVRRIDWLCIVIGAKREMLRGMREE